MSRMQSAFPLLMALVVGLLVLPVRGDDPPKTTPAADPLLEAIRQLQQEVDLLRQESRELRGLPSKSEPPDAPAMQAPTRAAPVEPPTAPRVSSIKSTGETTSKSTGESTSDTTSAKSTPPRPPAAASDHWAFQPLRQGAPPAVDNEAWIRDDLDRYVLARLEQADLSPNRDASRHALIRRLAFDLTGLPPTEKEVQAFVEDPASDDDALATVVDAYLASPRFGERWGRHWLDVVRYADSVGRTWNAPFNYAWRYRDWVIDALNDDKPYDRFIVEQLAGDLLPADSVQEKRANQIATGLLTLAPLELPESQSAQFQFDRIDDQIDVTSRAFLALTISCARCHDHKYDPISMRDYYALAGVFTSSETFSGQRRGEYVAADRMLALPEAEGERVTPSPRPIGMHSMSDITAEQRRNGYRDVRFDFDNNLALGVVEGRPEDCAIRVDGKPYETGPTPPRGDLRIAGLPLPAEAPPGRSGRLEISRWIASAEHPLTARVMANRVWQHLFGRGLVRTVDNFGASGEEPSHPELLDHVAQRFLDRRWSVKQLIRAIVLSRTYRLSSAGSAASEAIDPQNALYWRQNLRRLELEALRDAMLDVAGRLTVNRPPGLQIAGTGGKGRWGLTRSLLAIESPYRTVYLPVLRDLLPEMYQMFDFPEPSQIQGQREVTTVAPQALFLLNSDFAVQCAEDTARVLLRDVSLTDEQRLAALYLRLLARSPSPEETADALEFLNSLQPSPGVRDPALYRWSALTQALLASAEFRSIL
ncbi:MAG: DUF1549 domain-containing protein [Pirellulaceae bacterium]